MKTVDDFSIFKATLLDSEPDRARIRWRKNKKLVIRRGKTTAYPKRTRPTPKEYWEVLRVAKVNLNECEQCFSDYKITVHHKDGNPFNNNIWNLQVLCWHCHSLIHEPDGEDIRDELEGTKADIDPLDDPEARRVLGIVDEEEDIQNCV